MSTRFYCPQCRCAFSYDVTPEEAALIRANDSICQRCMEDNEAPATLLPSWAGPYDPDTNPAGF